MPDRNTPLAAHPTRQAVEAQFFNRPTLCSVTAQMLARNLTEKYPPLTHPLADLRLAVPRDGGGRALLPLLDVALNHLADGSFPDVSTRQGLDSYLSTPSGTRLSYPANGSRADELLAPTPFTQVLGDPAHTVRIPIKGPNLDINSDPIKGLWSII
ncbi:hypothetical protein L9Z73_30530, partial [Pseudomonas sp. TNT11]